ncbi:MAG: hypothetical protein R2698_03870 [Microthrixaceae bacterium]
MPCRHGQLACQRLFECPPVHHARLAVGQRELLELVLEAEAVLELMM